MTKYLEMLGGYREEASKQNPASISENLCDSFTDEDMAKFVLELFAKGIRILEISCVEDEEPARMKEVHFTFTRKETFAGKVERDSISLTKI